MNGYDWAFEHEVLNTVLAGFQVAFLSNPTVPNAEFPKSFSQAGWLATLLANSNSHKHRQKALLFAALSKKCLPDACSVEALCYTIFARTGALPAARHLRHIVHEQQYTGPPLGPLSDEFLASYLDSYSDLDGGMVLTEFQSQTVQALREKRSGVISAPTSAGKSFIVHEYVKSRLRSGERFLALFIVPTKALIAQTCAIYRRFKATENANLSIHSSVSEEMDVPEGSAVFALTQERCIRLLSTPIVRELSFVFADEIQSLEKDDRGVLLEYVLHEMKALSPSSQFFVAGPFIANGQELGASLFGDECIGQETKDSPVSQMIIQLTPVKGEKTLQVNITDSNERKKDFIFHLDTKQALYSRWQSRQVDAIVDSIHAFATHSPSIVYAKGPGTAGRWAKGYCDELEDSGPVAAEVNDLIAYLNDSIHPECSLINCLRRRLAYHHGGLPDFVREEIEELFKQGEIDVLFCTSTLLEGVNLPADKIFVVSPKKADEALSAFEFKNLTGRAGRLDQHLCGMVYCVNIPKDDGVNPFDAFRGAAEKKVKPTVDERLASSFDRIRSLLVEGAPLLPEDDDGKLRGTVTILRSRFLRGKEHARAYLAAKTISDGHQEMLLDALETSIASLTMPHELALRNPYVDPFLQDALYRAVLKDPSAWTIRAKRGFRTDFERVLNGLDGIFHIVQEIEGREDHSMGEFFLSYLVTYAKLWLFGERFRKIVDKMLARSDVYSVDGAVAKAMKYVGEYIGFVVAKYFSVLADILKATVLEAEQAPFTTTLALPAMLELGCSDPKTLALVTACIPRGAALKIAPLIPDEVEDPVVWLTLHQRDSRLASLSSIYHKILRRCGIWD